MLSMYIAWLFQYISIKGRKKEDQIDVLYLINMTVIKCGETLSVEIYMARQFDLLWPPLGSSSG